MSSAEVKARKRKSPARLRKEEIVRKIVEGAKEFPTVMFADFGRSPADFLQRIRKELAPDTKLMVVKKRLVPIAFSKVDFREGLNKLLDHMPQRLMIIFSKESPWGLYQKLREKTVNVDILPGEVAKEDIVIPAGPTDLAPGPILTDLRALGVPTKIVGGKISISEDFVIVRKGEKVQAQIAEILKALGIKPVEVRLEVSGAVDREGIFWSPEVLAKTREEILEELGRAAGAGIALAIEQGIVTDKTVEPIVARAAQKALALASEIGWVSPKTAELILRKAAARARALEAALGLSS